MKKFVFGFVLVFHSPGQSMIDFLFDIVELSQGLHTSYVVLQSRPIASKWVNHLANIYIS